MTVRYERAVALLGYTHAELLDEVVDAFAARDAAAAFAAIDRVVQTGQDPRRFVDDLLERLRDLIVVERDGSGRRRRAARHARQEELARMARQADVFGAAQLSRTADLVIAALDEMTGATSPRLQLELLVARVLAQGAAASPRRPWRRLPPSCAAARGASGPFRASDSETKRPRRPPCRRPPSSARSAPVAERAQPEPRARRRPERPDHPAAAARRVARGARPPRADQPFVVAARLPPLSRPARAATCSPSTFQSQSDVAKFKQLSAGAGPSEDLRTGDPGGARHPGEVHRQARCRAA